MAVIAPDPKKNKSSASGKLPGFILFLLIVIGIPFMAVKVFSSAKSAASSSIDSITKTVNDLVQQSESLSSSAADSDVSQSGTSAFTVATSSQMEQASALAADSTRFNAESSYYYGIKPKTDRKGLYELTGPVVDAAGILTKSQYLELSDFILELQNQYGAQIAVLIVPDMKGESIESFSMRHAEKWQLGQKGIDNGALLTVAMEEHDVRIETGYGTEGTLTDAKCSRIIRSILVPQFKKGNYSQGIIEAVKNMGGIIISNPELITINNSANFQEDEGDLSPGQEALVIVVLIFFLLMLGILKGVSRFGRHRRSIFWGPIIFGSGSHSGSSHHSSGGFGGFGGGGGSFGGGGASGHW